MIYQLAKTTPLLTGQVKMNLIMNGNKVSDIQYVPISNHIAFNYNNPVDVLNYSHGDNVKMLYNKISDDFFSDIHDPQLTVKQLHRYDTLLDDTHENTYEMGMKRLEYQRYNKQFEFFCPVWCDDVNDLKRIRFVINLANSHGRIMYSKDITFDTKIYNYLRGIYDSLNFDTSTTTENLDLVYINIDEMQSHIKGLNVESGTLQTIDTSYIVNNLLYQERPVLETDNMIVNLFSNNKTICTQIFNFNFVFNLEDFIPLNLLKNFISERINVYVDVYSVYGTNKTKCKVKDFYTNYEFIPKYDINTGKYSNTANVLDYLQDNKAVELVNKNKLVQSTFHWVLQNNRNSIFNLYNGFSPLNNGKNVCSGISNDAPDMFTDVFDENKNPLGIFKLTDLSSDSISNLEFVNRLNGDIYFSLPLSTSDLNKKEYQFFGNILLSNSKISEYITKCSSDIDILENTTNKDTKKLSDYYIYPSNISKKYDDYSDNFKINAEDTGNIKTTQIVELNCAVVKIPATYQYTKLRNLLNNTYLLTELEYIDVKEKSAYNSQGGNFLAVKCELSKGENIVSTSSISEYDYGYDENYVKNENLYKLYIIVFVHEIDEFLKRNISFRNLYDIDFIRDLIDIKDNDDWKQSCYYHYYPETYTKTYIVDKVFSESASRTSRKKIKYMTQKRMCYNALNLVANIIKCTKLPNDIVFEKSFSYKKTDSPSINTNEVELLKVDKFVELYRYDSNILPMFIDLNYSIFKNNVYWCKQYDQDIQKQLNSNKKDLDGIAQYSKYALKKYRPLYNSIGYYVLNSKTVDYENYYLNGYDTLDGESGYRYKKEKSWYKNNSIIYLPVTFSVTLIKETGEGVSDTDIEDCIYNEVYNESEGTSYDFKKLVKYYIKNLYKYTYTYDYISRKDISKQRIEIKFTLK